MRPVPTTKGGKMKGSVMTRLVPDDSGEFVTYLPISATAELVGVGMATICRWNDAGLLRSIGILKNAHYVSVVDASFLRVLTPQKAKELGIIKSPTRTLAKQRAYVAEVQQNTRPAAHHYEEWDSYDIGFVIDGVEAGTHVKDIAVQLGRTYFSVCCMIDRLRTAGDLPPATDKDTTWQARVKALLTATEQDRLEEVLS
jgi:hypothetical protein